MVMDGDLLKWSFCNVYKGQGTVMHLKLIQYCRSFILQLKK